MDPSFKGFLVNLEVDAAMIEAVEKAGYKKAHVFKSTFSTEARLDAWMQKQIVQKKILGDVEDDTEWDFFPTVGSLRTAWRAITDVKPVAGAGGTGATGLGPDSSSGVVGQLERLELEKNFSTKFPHEVLMDSIRPGLVLLTIVKRMVRKDSGLQPVPWGKVRSLEQEKAEAGRTRQELETLARLGAETRQELQSLAEMRMLAEVSTVIQDAEQSAQWQGGAFKMQRLFECLSLALCFFNVGSLAAWKFFHGRFLDLFLKAAPRGMRGPNVQEAMEAHFLALETVFEVTNKAVFLKGDLSKLADTIDEQVKASAALGGALESLMRPRVADLKRSLPEDQKEDTVPKKKQKCRFFLKGRCKKGNNCDFTH